MLLFIKDRATGWIAGVIVILLVISFSFWGVSFYFGDGSAVSNIVRVNGNDITQRDFQRTVHNFRQQFRFVADEALSFEADEIIKQQALERLIDAEIINQIVNQQGLHVTDAMVLDTIRDIDVFKNESGFSRSLYERSVQGLGMDTAYFEKQLQTDLMSEQLQTGLSESLFVLKEERNTILRLKQQIRDISYTVLDHVAFINDDDISEEDVEAFYQSNSQRYTEPEKVKIAYIDLNVEEIAKQIETDEDSLRGYYNDNRDIYDLTEQRSMTRLFVKTADKTLKEESNEVNTRFREVIDAALIMVKEGKPFEEIVETFTEEGKAALQFSEHALLLRGVMDEEIDEFLFSAGEGDTSDVIETKTSLNIVKVGEIRGGTKNNYENVARKVEEDYRVEQAELQYFALYDQLANLSYEHPDTLEIAAEAIGKTVINTDYFTREGGSGITADKNVIAGSFDFELINSDHNSDVIELSDTHSLVLKVLDHKPATTKPFAEVREEVVEHIKLDRAKQKAREIGETIIAEIKAGAAVADIDTVEDYKIEWSVAEKAMRDSPDINRAVLRRAFQAGEPGEDKPAIAGQFLGSGDYAVVVVTAVYDGSELETNDAENNILEKSAELELKRAYGNNEWQTLLENAKNRATITVFDDNI